MWRSALLLVLAAVALSSGFLLGTGSKHQGVLDMYHKTYHGDGTYYGKVVGGTCSYGTSQSDLPAAAQSAKITSLVALNAPQFMNSLTCGMCLKGEATSVLLELGRTDAVLISGVTGSGQGLGNDPITGEFLVFVKDLCPECHTGSVDLAENGDGRWKVSIRAVQCPVGSSKIEYSFQGSNPWYVKLQVRNARIPIVSVELQRNGQWVSPQHVSDNYWVVSDGQKFQDGPIPIKMTAANGQVLEDVVPKIANMVLKGQKGVQVALDSSLPSA